MIGGIHVTRALTERPGAIPLVVRWRHKWPAGVALCGFASAVYLLANHFHFSPPRELPLTALDLAIPFIPQTVWIYWSGVFFVPAVYAANRCIVSLNRHLYSFTAVVLASAAIFSAWPTTYPRALYPEPATLDSATSLALGVLRAIDEPASCTPSLHVSLAYLIAFGFIDDRRELLAPMLAWATLMALSTLTTKQHYVVDAIAGFGMAVVFFMLFHRLVPSRLSAAIRLDISERA